MRQVFRRPFTVMYPFKKRDVPPNHRGRHIFVQQNCTACTICARVCQTVAIHLDREKKEITIDYTRCIFCNYCVEGCPFNALQQSPDFELSEYTRKELVYTPQMLATPRTTKRTWRKKECI